MKRAFVSSAMVSLLAVSALHAAAAPQAGRARPAAAPTHVVNAEFVAYDAKTHILTVKNEKGQTSSAPLQGSGLREVTDLHLKYGDRVMLTCRDNAKGEHQAVTAIKLAKSKM